MSEITGNLIMLENIINITFIILVELYLVLL